ncbi:hypothetical protein [Collinsella tanakaei]|uniref:hypothetical protein n=1 Tax=Collinsella tanakaei TaxID=626935 RepID=UPI0025A45BEE|nr:hypothetical protein [Collinsella tanakaei]MDM8300905.1 hypothetical protein [Collinsella tanakaei]
MKMDVKLRRFLVFALVVFTVGIWAPATAVAAEGESGTPPVTDAAEATDSYWTVDDTGALIPADENEYDVRYDGKGLLVIQDAVPGDTLQGIVDELGIKLPSDEDDPGLIVFTGDAGVVYGNATLTSDLVIGEKQILTVPEGATLTIPEGVTLTNDGTIEVIGSMIDAGTIVGTGDIVNPTVMHEHQLIEVAAKAPTCTDDGNIAYWYCEGCGRYFSDAEGAVEIAEEETIDPATDHARAATWSSDEHGHWYACENGCDTKLGYAKHTPAVEGKTDATCTKGGYTGDTVCSACGYMMAKGETVAALEHSFTNYVSNGDATCTTDGTETATCDNGCGATDTRTDEGSQLDHKVATVGAAHSTCTEKGYTGDKVCELCGKVLEKGKTIDALGHAWGKPTWSWSEDGEQFVATFTCEHDADHTKVLTVTPTASVKTKSTCTAAGVRLYRGTVELDGAAYSATATETLPAIEHDMKDGVCTICGAKDPDYVKQVQSEKDKKTEPKEEKEAETIPATGDVAMEGVIGLALIGMLALGVGAPLKRHS